MFNALETETTIKLSYNKLLLLFIILYISPLSHELEQKKQKQQPPTLVSSSTDNLIVKRDFELIFENFTCSNSFSKVGNTSNNNSTAGNAVAAADHMQIMEKLSCSLTKNAKRHYLQMEMSFKRQINHLILIILHRPRYEAEKLFILLNLTSIDGCDLLSLKNQVTLIYWTRHFLQHYNNLPKKCPLLPNTLYYIRGFKWDMEKMWKPYNN